MPEPGRFRVLVVGCGELGTRHLQAVAGLAEVGRIDIVDPREVAHTLGKQRLAEIGESPSGGRYAWHTSIDGVASGVDLCVVSTQSDVRVAVTEQVAARVGCRAFLLEKVAARSVGEYQRLLAMAAERGLSVWVNCKTRAYPIQKRIKARLVPGAPLVFTSTGGNHGLTNNGIHAVDLFVFFDDCDAIESNGASIDPDLQPSKRGATVFDLAGTLRGRTANGSELMVSLCAGHAAPPLVTVTTPQYRWIIDDMTHDAWESDAASGWAWAPLAFDEDLRVSVMTRAFARDILRTGTCELPTLRECWPAHAFVLGELLPHFSERLHQPLDVCPIA